MNTTTASLVSILVAAASGLVGALIGGLITLKVSHDSFEQQLALEDCRYQHRLEMDEAQRQRAAAALKRRLVRSLERLHYTSRLSTSARVSLGSWTKAAATLADLLEDPQVDALLSDPEYDAIWDAANEGTAVTTILRIAADGACQGAAPNPAVAEASIRLFEEKLRGAFGALAEPEREREVSDSLTRGFVGCGIFLVNDLVFCPIPADGKSFIVGYRGAAAI
ncbi:MAG TPA: hypothetical protein VGI19_14615 [Candidatus Cybelea sp.]|jgi:hypothetical protein